jgi:tetratricopeptide (TPR) repeat protein
MENRDSGQSKPKNEVRGILDYQQSLKEAREKVSTLAKKNIFVVSSDKYVRELVKGYFDTLGFPADHIKMGDSSSNFISVLKQNPDSVDLLICHLKPLDNAASKLTGLQFMQIIRDALLSAGSKKAIPVLLMDKTFDKKEIVSAIKGGASSVVLLPSTPVQFGTKISASFDENTPPSPSPSRDEVYALLLNGKKYRDQGDYEEAIGSFNKALALGGEKVEILNEKGNAYLMMGDLDKAVAVFKRAVEVEATFPRAYQGLGEAYAQLGNFHEAKKNFLKVVELEPKNVHVFHSIGSLCQEVGDLDGAKIYFTKGIGLNPKFAKNYLGLAKNYEHEGRHKEALKVYLDAIDQNPTFTILHATAGDFCLKHDLYADAEEIFDKAIGLNEDHMHLYNSLGVALRRQGKYDKAIANYSKALKIKNNDPNLQYNLAKAYYLKGEEEKAVETLLSAIKLDSGLMNSFKSDEELSKLREKFPARFAKI